MKIARISEVIDSDGKVIYEKPKALQIFKSGYKENNISPYHSTYLNYVGFEIERIKEPNVMMAKFGK